MKQAQFKYQIGSKYNLSFFTKISAANCLFGDNDNQEPNIAYSLLKLILNIDIIIRQKLVQNIILTGGNVQLPGFTRRLREEMIKLIDQHSEFEQLKTIKQFISFTDLIYPGNTSNFISASIISKLSGIENFQVKKQQFQDLGNTIPDYIGKSFIQDT